MPRTDNGDNFASLPPIALVARSLNAAYNRCCTSLISHRISCTLFGGNSASTCCLVRRNVNGSTSRCSRPSASSPGARYRCISARVTTGGDRSCVSRVKHRRRWSQISRHQPVHEREQFEHTILNGRASEHEPMTSTYAGARCIQCTGGVAHSVTLVENTVFVVDGIRK